MDEDKINIAILNTKLENINESIKVGFSDNKEDHDSIRREIINFKEEMEEKYATKKEMEPLISIYGSIQNRLIYLVLFLMGVVAILFEVIINKINK